jgi:CheY-like chemotaxis protein
VDGYEAARRMRASEHARGVARVPILALTGQVQTGDENACRRAGMDDYLTKPLDQTRLVAKLELLLGLATGAAEQTDRPVQDQGGPLALDLRQAEAFLASFSAQVGRAPSLRVLRTFLENVPRQADLLWEVCCRHGQGTSPDRSELRARAHALRGAARSLGLLALSEAIEVLEQSGTNDPSLAESAARTASLRQRLLALCAALAQRVENEPVG